ncbi:MAG TPA: chromosome segregation protein SMC [Firmicutes bacterium]|nr:chromosome segregation protein SMC [Bacillota bacterium]
MPLYLKRLEIYGFKSFAERTVLLFDPGLTAFVGPNGSGKSNLADALRWALGEQSARSLRSTRMEDVIFAGSLRERPLGYAEVAVTLDNEDGRLPLPASEVVLSRRLYRSGESEYMINRTPCRLRDIQELLFDQGLGGGAFLVGQGEIAAVVAARPEERRLILEDIAGTSRFRRRREEVLARLDQVERDRRRLADLVAAQKEELERKRPEVERIIREEIREYALCRAEEELYRYRLEALLTARRRLRAKEEAEAEAARRLAEELAATDACLVELAGREEAARTSAEEKEAIRSEWERKRESARSTLTEVERAAETVRTELESAGRALTEARHELDALIQRVARAVEEEQAAQEAYERARAEWEACQQEGEALASRWQADLVRAGEWQRKADQIREHIAARLREREVVDARLAAKRAEEEQAVQNLAQAEELRQEAESVVAMLCDEEKALQDRLRLAEAALKASRAELAGAAQVRERCRQETAELEKRHQEQEARLRALAELQDQGEGLPPAVRRLLRERPAPIVGVLADLLVVPPELSRAVDAALGAAQVQVVVPGAEEARRAIAFLRQESAGRATFLPLAELRPRPPGQEDREALERFRGHGFQGFLSDLVAIRPEAQKALCYTLGRVALFDDLGAAIACARALSPAVRCVTLAGDVVIPGGPISGGGEERERGSSRLSRQSAIARLQKEVEESGRAYVEASARWQEAEQRYRHLQVRVHEAEKEYALLEQRLSQVRQNLEAALRRAANARQKAEAARAARKQLAREREELAARKERLLAGTPGSAPGEEDWERIAARAESLRDRVRGEEKSYLERQRALEVALATRRAEWERARDRRQFLESSVTAARERVVEAEEEFRRQAERGQVLARAKEEATTAWQMTEERWQQAVSEAGQARRRYQEVRRDRQKAESRRRELEQARNRAEASLARIRLALARLEGEIRLAGERHQHASRRRVELEKRGLEPAGPFPWAEVTGYRRRLLALRREREAMIAQGPRPTGLVEEYEQEMRRLEETVKEMEDVEAAREELLAWLEKEEAVARRQLEESFREAQGLFGQTFVRLFGGGSARLIWVGDDPLSGGIEIEASPPGKRPQALSLLSGGERALTALAFLLGLAQMKPPPFCVLDEADGSLDESNLGRFLLLLEELSSRIQFLVITHRRQTMERAGMLYGVTMDRRGVSRVYAYHLEGRGEVAAVGSGAAGNERRI